MKKKVLLVDGNSFCYRAFYAIRSLVNSQGQPTNAVYGFVNMLNKLIAAHKPGYLAVAFDLKGPTFRHQKFTEYKLHRKPMPDELSAQIPMIKKVLQAYRIAIFEQQGYEADDIIASLAGKLSSPELAILVVTADKDMLQIVNSSVQVINPHKDNLVLDESWVRQRYGVEPKKIAEIMALSGDPTDNIPGVPGIGAAGAIELIKKFGSLEDVFKNIDQINNKTKAARIKEFAQQAQMSRELAVLDSNITTITQRPQAELLQEMRLGEPDRQGLFELFKELEFKTLMQSVAGEFADKSDCQVITDKQQVQNCIQRIVKNKRLIFYLDATDPDPMLAQIKGITVLLEKNEIVYFPSSKTNLDKLRPVLEDADIKKIGHNLKYARVALSGCGIDLNGIYFDTMIAAYLINPEKLKYNLSDLALEYLDCKLQAAQDQDLEQQAQAQLVQVIFNLEKILLAQLKQKNLLPLYEQIEIPLVEVLAEMERQGVSLNKDLLLRLAHDFEEKLKGLTRDIYQMAGEEFNINSPKQLSVILFEKLKLPKIKRTKTGISTDTEVLRRLSSAHPIASSLLEFREISKLKSTYLDGMLKLLNPQTKRIHTSFNQTATATGRLSSSQPNLQNIPIKTKLGRSIRQIFIPNEKKNLLLSADYSQIELRILAHLSGDEGLILAFQQDLDIHSYTASLIFGVEPEAVLRQMRDSAKTVNFGIIYGMSAYGLAKDLGIKQEQAQEFIDAYFQRYPGVKAYIASQVKKAQEEGFVTTLLKRRRYIPEIESSNENVRQFAQRVAINAPVQGSASDLIKAAMIGIYHSLKERGLETKMVIQVHDELVFSVPEKELSLALELIREKMENVIKLKVPIKISLKRGKNWLDME